MDIDIDVQSNFSVGKILDWTRASQVKNGDLVSHPCGHYPQNIPVDHLTSLAAIPYAEAEQIGYFKVDFLHLHIYNHFKSRDEITALLQIEPDWNLLLVPSVQKKLFQLSNHGDVLNIIRPRCVEDLADVLALIRPGKRELIKLYKSNKDVVKKNLYRKTEGQYSFKKSHAVAYSLVIVLQLHLIEAGII